MKTYQSQSTSNPTSISQVAAQAALEGDQSCISEMLEAFKARHGYVVERVNAIDGIEAIEGDGTFYTLPSVQPVIERMPGIEDDVALAEFLLNDAEVAVVPGSAFGSPGTIRISFATSMTNLEKALDRIAKALG